MNTWKRLIATDNDHAAAIARLALGIVILPHGLQKATHLFGGYGIGGTLGFFGTLGIPAWAGTLVIAAELLGAIGLITGALGRIAASGLLPVMAGAVLLTHLPNGFFMNWGGTQAGEGFEYHILVIALAVVVIIKGSGSLSVDRWLSSRDAVQALPERALSKVA
jgi:putative oxidoreductase